MNNLGHKVPEVEQEEVEEEEAKELFLQTLLCTESQVERRGGLKTKDRSKHVLSSSQFLSVVSGQSFPHEK